MEPTKLEHIPLLGDDSTELQVVSYLRWLWRSPFQYHLDDDVNSIVWGGLKEQDNS